MERINEMNMLMSINSGKTTNSFLNLVFLSKADYSKERISSVKAVLKQKCGNETTTDDKQMTTC